MQDIDQAILNNEAKRRSAATSAANDSIISALNRAPAYTEKEEKGKGEESKGFISRLIGSPADDMEGISKSISAIKSLSPSSIAKEIGDRKLDKKLDDTKRRTTFYANFQRFLATDPVGAEADPEKAYEIAESLYQTNPDFAMDKAQFTYAMREALQYGSLPLNMVASLASVRKELAQAKKDEAASNDSKYKV
jgi:ribosomal protein L12E/L44/L45/RPP1/RPP2